MMKLKDLIGKNKIIFALVLLCALGAVLMLTADGKKSDTDTTNEEYTARVENKIEQMVSAICGGDAKVIVTLECGEETQYARDLNSESDASGGKSVSEEYVVMSGKEALVQRVIEPKIRGIAVACKGGDDAALQLRIISALSCAYGISSCRICVVPLR